MSKKSKSTSRQQRSPLATLISFLIVALAALFGAIGGGLVEQDSTAPVATPQPAPTQPAPTQPAGTRVAGGGLSSQVTTIQLSNHGLGARKGFWEVYFTTPTGSRDYATYRNGVDYPLAAAIDGVQSTLDIAAYEWNSPRLTEAVVNALRRGVRVRMVVDDEGTFDDDDGTIQQVIDAGAQVRDDSRSALMHNKFMLLDSAVVWSGSTNFTVNDVYRNNNNLIMLRSRRAVQAYQAEFDEMFTGGAFGPRSSDSNSVSTNQDGTPIQIYFAPENDVLRRIVPVIESAQRSIRFMAFSFTEADIANAMIARTQAGVSLRGVFETRGSETQFSELRALYCIGLDVRQDGNPFTFHHKVLIVDERIVVTGSFNWSENATTANDENLLIIEDADLAALYLGEFDRVWSRATVPDRALCQ